MIRPYVRKAVYYETDQMGVVHHSNYIRWFEEARTDMMDQMGLSYKTIEERGIFIPVLRVSCDYKRSVLFDEIVLIHTEITEFNGIKFYASYRVIKKDSLELRATGTSVHCFVNKNMVPVKLKKEYPDIYEIFQCARNETMNSTS